MLQGKKIIITSGPTRMPLDAVRFISNISSGYFGTLVAREALRKKARVTFVYGKGSRTPPKHPSLKLIPVETNLDVAQTLKKLLTKKYYDAVIHAMAVLDFQANHVRPVKTKTRKGRWNIDLKPTPKIILKIKKWSPHSVLVGFKLEVGISQDELLSRARRLVKKSKADFVLANQLTQGDDKKHGGWLLDRNGKLIAKARGKQNLAKLIIRNIGRCLK